jgi:aspartate oxidase
MKQTDVRCDVLVIGSGVAGLSFALKIADYAQVIMITKREKNEPNTYYAQGGVAAVLSPDDSFEQHIHDTVVCGVCVGALRCPPSFRCGARYGFLASMRLQPSH